MSRAYEAHFHGDAPFIGATIKFSIYYGSCHLWSRLTNAKYSLWWVAGYKSPTGCFSFAMYGENRTVKRCQNTVRLNQRTTPQLVATLTVLGPTGGLKIFIYIHHVRFQHFYSMLANATIIIIHPRPTLPFPPYSIPSEMYWCCWVLCCSLHTPRSVAT